MKLLRNSQNHEKTAIFRYSEKKKSGENDNKTERVIVSVSNTQPVKRTNPSTTIGGVNYTHFIYAILSYKGGSQVMTIAQLFKASLA